MPTSVNKIKNKKASEPLGKPVEPIRKPQVHPSVRRSYSLDPLHLCRIYREEEEEEETVLLLHGRHALGGFGPPKLPPPHLAPPLLDLLAGGAPPPDPALPSPELPLGGVLVTAV